MKTRRSTESDSSTIRVWYLQYNTMAYDTTKLETKISKQAARNGYITRSAAQGLTKRAGRPGVLFIEPKGHAHAHTRSYIIYVHEQTGAGTSRYSNLVQLNVARPSIAGLLFSATIILLYFKHRVFFPLYISFTARSTPLLAQKIRVHLTRWCKRRWEDEWTAVFSQWRWNSVPTLMIPAGCIIRQIG